MNLCESREVCQNSLVKMCLMAWVYRNVIRVPLCFVICSDKKANQTGIKDNPWLFRPFIGHRKLLTIHREHQSYRVKIWPNFTSRKATRLGFSSRYFSKFNNILRQRTFFILTWMLIYKYLRASVSALTVTSDWMKFKIEEYIVGVSEKHKTMPIIVK